MSNTGHSNKPHLGTLQPVGFAGLHGVEVQVLDMSHRLPPVIILVWDRQRRHDPIQARFLQAQPTQHGGGVSPSFPHQLSTFLSAVMHSFHCMEKPVVKHQGREEYSSVTLRNCSCTGLWRLCCSSFFVCPICPSEGSSIAVKKLEFQSLSWRSRHNSSLLYCMPYNFKQSETWRFFWNCFIFIAAKW